MSDLAFGQDNDGNFVEERIWHVEDWERFAAKYNNTMLIFETSLDFVDAFVKASQARLGV